jgi:hypothetical protein
MLDAARITLADHRTYSRYGIYIVFTSSIGSHQFLWPTRLPFTTLERAVISAAPALSPGTHWTLRGENCLQTTLPGNPARD